jgi:hypothetical protein
MTTLVRTLVVLVLAAGSVAVAGTAAGRTVATPSVRLVDLAPLEVAGTGFGKRAPVRITVSWSGKHLVRVVRSTRTGAITVSFRASLTPLACRGASILAVAANGLRATWRPGTKSCYAIAVPVEPSG